MGVVLPWLSAEDALRGCGGGGGPLSIISRRCILGPVVVGVTTGYGVVGEIGAECMLLQGRRLWDRWCIR